MINSKVIIVDIGVNLKGKSKLTVGSNTSLLHLKVTCTFKLYDQ
jgi:hypothetical protein